jgi:hypothetical protein
MAKRQLTVLSRSFFGNIGEKYLIDVLFLKGSALFYLISMACALYQVLPIVFTGFFHCGELALFSMKAVILPFRDCFFLIFQNHLIFFVDNNSNFEISSICE